MWVMGGFTSSRSHDIFLVDRFHFLQLDTSYPCHTSHLVLTSPCTAPTSSSPPVGESLFVMYYVSKLTNPLLPPLQLVSPLCHATFSSSRTPSSFFLPFIHHVFIY